MSQFAHLEKFNLNFSSSSFAICVNLLHPKPSLVHYGLLSSLCGFSSFSELLFSDFLQFNIILYVAKVTQHAVTELL